MSKLPSRQRLIRWVSGSLLTRLIMLLCRLLRNVVLAHILGPAARGVLSFAIAAAELMMIAMSVGLNTSIGYHASQASPLNRLKLFRYVVLLSVSLGSLMSLAVMALYAVPAITNNGLESLVKYAIPLSLIMPFLLVKALGMTCLNGFNRVGVFNYLRLLDSLVPLLLFLALWQWSGWSPLSAALLSWLAAIGCVAVLTLVALVKATITLPSDGEENSQRYTLTSIFDYGRRSYFDSVFQTLLLRSDHLIIGVMLGATPLGLYAMATTAVELLLIISEAATVPLFSYFQSRLKHQHEMDVIGITVRLTNIAVLLCGFALALFGKVLILALFGADFLGAYTVLLILIPGIVCLNFCAVSRLIVLGQNKPISVSKISGLSFFLNLILNILLIPIWHIEGAALASSVAYLCAAVLYYRTLTQTTTLTARALFLPRFQDFEVFRHGAQVR